MSLVSLVVASVLIAVGTYLVLQRLLTRVIIGLGLISHGANLLIMLSAGAPGAPPVLAEGVDPAAVSDPLPQAMVLTAIVITFGVTAFLALALRGYLLTGSDAVEDDLEDRRIIGTDREVDEEYADDDMHEETV